MPCKSNPLQNEGSTYVTLVAWKRWPFPLITIQKISNISRIYHAGLCLSPAELLEGAVLKISGIASPSPVADTLKEPKVRQICSVRMRFYIFTPHPYSKLLDLSFYFPSFSAVVEMCWKHGSWEKAQIICLSMALLWNPSSNNAKDQLNLQLG